MSRDWLTKEEHRILDRNAPLEQCARIVESYWGGRSDEGRILWHIADTIRALKDKA